MKRISLKTLGPVLFATVILAILAAPVVAWTPVEYGGLGISEPGAQAVPGDINAQLAASQGRISVQNKSGSAVVIGDCVIWDSTAITVVTAAVATDDMTIAESLSSEGGVYSLIVTESADLASAHTVTITGTDWAGNVQTEAMAIASGETVQATYKLWKTVTDFDAVDAANDPQTIKIEAYPVNGVKDNAGNDATFAGIVVVAGADNAEVTIATRGQVMANVLGTAVLPGDVLSCSATAGSLDEDGTAAMAIAGQAVSDTTDLIQVLIVRDSD